MNLIYFLVSTLLKYDSLGKQNLLDTRIKTTRVVSLYTIDDRSIPSVHNLSREILYESFISIDTLLFLVETGVVSSKQLEKFIDNTVLKAKKLLLSRPDLRKHFADFNTKIDMKNDKLKHILEVRNKVFANDKSQISRALTRDRIFELDKRATSHVTLFDEDKDAEYKRMIHALIDTKNSDDGVQVNLSKERFEFYRQNVTMSKKEVLDAKMSLNLGGAIFDPGLLSSLIKRMTTCNKQQMTAQTLSAMFDSIELLHKNTIGKSYMTKKKEIIEYLVNCLEIKNSDYRYLIDIAFYNRTVLIEQLVKDEIAPQKFYNILDKEQEKEIRKLIYTFENMNEKQLKHVMLHDQNLKKVYLEYLCDGKEENKERLFKLFKNLI